MKKWVLVLVLAVLFTMIPTGTAEGEPMGSGAVYECCVEIGMVVMTVLPQEERQPEPIRADAEDTCLTEEYQEYCEEIGERYNIYPELLMAIAEQESSGDPQVVNSAGDTGLLQVNPKWHSERMERLGVTDLTDPYSNILVSADYLAELFERDGGDLYLVLMKYNMKHDRAEELFGSGIYSDYAVSVSERARELELIHEQEGE